MFPFLIHWHRAKLIVACAVLLLTYKAAQFVQKFFRINKAFAQYEEILNPPLENLADSRRDAVLQLRGLDVGVIRLGFLRADPKIPHTFEVRIGTQLGAGWVVAKGIFVKEQGEWKPRSQAAMGDFQRLFCTTTFQGCRSPVVGADAQTLSLFYKENADKPAREVVLRIKEILPEQNTAAVAKQIQEHAVPLFLVTPEGAETSDWNEVRRVLRATAQSAREAEALITQSFSEIPYVSQRRIFNVSRYFERLLAVSEGGHAAAETLQVWQGTLRALFAEDQNELPLAFQEKAPRDLLLNSDLRWCWMRALLQLANRTQTEIQHILTLEESRKEAVTLRVHVAKMAPRSVLRAHIQAKAALFKVEVLSVGTGENKVSGGTTPGKLALDALAQARASGGAAQLDFARICSQGFGNAAVLFDQSPQEVLHSADIQGPWALVRGSFAFDFLARAAADSGCHKVTLYVRPADKGEFQALAKKFEKTLLQAETSLQIANGSVKKLRLLPGVYEVTVSSLLSGAILGKQTVEITVQQKKPLLAISL